MGPSGYLIKVQHRFERVDEDYNQNGEKTIVHLWHIAVM